jgi:hypothetical protein
MSQEKVERYKQEKANRKKIIKQEKRKALAVKIGISAVVLASVGWVGYSAYDIIQANKPETEIAVNLDSVNEYLAGLSTDIVQ